MQVKVQELSHTALVARLLRADDSPERLALLDEVRRRLEGGPLTGSIVTREAAQAFLREHHETMATTSRFGANDVGMAEARGLIRALCLVGLLTGVEATGWYARITLCPDNGEHGGGQSWCNYCSDVCRHCGLPLVPVVQGSPKHCECKKEDVDD